MEAKLAEFRKTHQKNSSSFDWYQFIPHLPSFASSTFSATSPENDNDQPPVASWTVIIIKVLVWLTLFVIFLRLQFGAIYFIVSLLYLIWSSLDSKRRQRDQLSAYSVFNPNFERLQGTFSAEDYERQLRRGTPFVSS